MMKNLSRTLFSFCMVLLTIPVLTAQQLQQVDFTSDKNHFLFTVLPDSGLYHYQRATQQLTRLGHGRTKKFSMLGDEGKMVLLSTHHYLELYEASSEKCLLAVQDVTDFVSNDSLLWLSNKKGEIWKLRLSDLKPIQQMKVLDAPVACMALTVDNTALVVAGVDGWIKKIDLRSRKIIASVQEPLGQVESMAFNEKGNFLYVSVGCALYTFSNGLQKVLTLPGNGQPLFNVRGTGKDFFVADGSNNQRHTSTIFFQKNAKSKYLDYQELPGPVQIRKGTLLMATITTGNKISLKFYDGASLREKGPVEIDPYLWPAKDSLKISLQKTTLSKKNNPPSLFAPTASIIDLTTPCPIAVKSETNKTGGPITLIPQLGFAAPLKEMLFSADQKYCIIMAESPVVKIWERKTRMLVKEIRLGEFNVVKAAIHPHWPLLAVWDRNQDIHLVDLNSLSVFRKVRYSDLRFQYVGDYRGDTDNQYRMYFNEGGSMLSIVNVESGNIYDVKEEYDQAKQINILTTDLLAGKVKPVTLYYNDQGVELEDLQAQKPIFDTYKDTVVMNRVISKEKFSLVYRKGVPCFYNAHKQDTITMQGTYFLDPELTQVYTPQEGELPGDLHYRVTNIREWYLSLVKQSHDGRFLLLKDDKGPRYYLYDNAQQRVLENNLPAEGNFLPDTAFYLYENGLVDLHKGRTIQFSALVETTNNKRTGNAAVLRYAYESRKKILTVWQDEFDHAYLEFRLRQDTVNVVKLNKPLIGKIKPSVDPPVAYVNHLQWFSKVDFINLKSTDYVIKEDLSGIMVRKGPRMRKTFERGILFKHDHFDGNSADNIMDLFVSGPWLEMFVEPRIRVSANLDDLSLKTESFYIGDSLLKTNFYRPRLTAAQRIQYEQNSYKFEDFGGIMRSHTRSGYEYAYLQKYDINVDAKFAYMTRDFDSMYIAGFNENYSLLLRSSLNGKSLRTFNVPTTGSYFLHFLDRQHKIVTYGYDGLMRIYDVKGQLNDPMVTYLRDEENYMFITHDNYYKTTSRAFNLIKFRKDNKVYGIEQFDLKYNRPDILLQRMGNTDTLLIKAYQHAYQKRLKKMGFTEEMLSGEINLPEIRINNFELLPEITETPALGLDLGMKDSKYKLDRINVYINDVPVYGSAGITLREDRASVLDHHLDLRLSTGMNKVQVSVLNQAGVESYQETVYISYQPKTTSKPDLYLVTIGDSKYRDSRFDLTYAAKDASDIQAAFEKNTAYGKVLTYHLTNENVTREKIMILKKELQKAQRDDVVMITVAGHGVLDKDLNYYLATYEMDFNDPAAKGLAYEELESLLDGIAPLKKVLLLDACHSGEVDKEEVEHLAVNNTTAGGEVKFRAAGAGIQKKTLGLKSTSELMSELFTDLRRGTGATVISSAGGVEYAMESDQWKNGLFTYCMLHGLKDGVADANGDGQIMLSELQQYLRTEVTRLSNGAQQPGSRIENMNMDFRIW